MTMPATRVRLGEVLTRSDTTTDIRPDETYREVTVRLWGKGVVLRREVLGSEIAAAHRYVVRAGQFILSRIDARNGAFGVVPVELHGAVVSSDFPVFETDQDRLFTPYLEWISKSPSFVDLCRRASEGTTNRVRLSEATFLDTTVMLPTVGEQRRIAATLQNAASRIAEAAQGAARVRDELEALVVSAEMRVWSNETLQGAPTLSEVTTHLARGRQSAQGESDHFLIKSQHVQMGRYIPTRLTLAPDVAQKVEPEAMVRPGDTLIACSAAGCLGRVAYFFQGGTAGSTDTHVAIARPDVRRVLPEYLYAYFSGAQGQYQLRSRERGDWTKNKVTFRLAELNQADLRKVPVPTPSLETQARIVADVKALRARVALALEESAAAAAHVEALVPSLATKAMQGEL